MEDNSEIVTKYQRLALEYSKLKAQNSVLKSAVSEEQTLSQELQENTKKKDQLIRKLEQEVECLNFRNLQLSKRVSVLQSDLENADSTQKNSKSKHTSNSSIPDSYAVLNNELQSRIEENEKLHHQIYAADLDNQNKISELSSMIESLQAKITEQEKKFNDTIKEQEILINGLQKEKIKMQVNIKNYEKEIKHSKSTEETVTRNITVANEDLILQLEEAKNTISNKVLFNDKSRDVWNSLNVPIIQRGKHDMLISLMGKLQSFVSDFSRQLCDLNTFMIQRLCDSSDPSIKPITDKLESHIRESIQQLKNIPMRFEDILCAIKGETLAWDKTALVNFCDTFQKYDKCLEKLLPFLILRIQNKDSWTTSSVKMVDLVPHLVALSRKFSACVKTMSRYLLLLAALGTAENTEYHVSQGTVIKKILSNVEALQLLFEEARKLFGSKISLDHQLPMLSESDKSTDECILSTLVSLSTSLKKIIDLMKKRIDVLSDDLWYLPRSTSKHKTQKYNSAVWKYKERGNLYIQQIGQAEELSIPYDIALKNYQTLCDYSDNQESLTQQLEQYKNKLMQLELDKENWMLECQLLKAKESKSLDASTEDGNESKAHDYDEIHSFVRGTVNQLIKQIQFADSKAVAFKTECDSLHQRLKLSLKKNQDLDADVTCGKKTIETLKDEQKTMMQSYDEQLNTMSEHLANLNETLTAQQDKIDQLEQGRDRKVLKKGRSK